MPKQESKPCWKLQRGPYPYFWSQLPDKFSWKLPNFPKHFCQTAKAFFKWFSTSLQNLFPSINGEQVFQEVQVQSQIEANWKLPYWCSIKVSYITIQYISIVNQKIVNQLSSILNKLS